MSGVRICQKNAPTRNVRPLAGSNCSIAGETLGLHLHHEVAVGPATLQMEKRTMGGVLLASCKTMQGTLEKDVPKCLTPHETRQRHVAERLRDGRSPASAARQTGATCVLQSLVNGQR